MVQRNIPTKPGLQPDHLQPETTLFQQQDLKNSKVADLKKKMKKSGSIKRPKQPGKPPPPPAPLRQSPVGKPVTTPNYMKPTTCSYARNEQSQSQVSTRNPNTSPLSSSSRRNSSDNSKLSVSSGKKATKTLLARTLTKNPSFKPARSSARKCSPVVFCENLDTQRATCSSTLKDCKFPAYLSLNPGGTESEGTSAIKVCPYTYCSLNGHHHAPLPPLKCFISARRRMIKTQRSIKLGCLSPRRAKPVGDDALIEEKSRDFFIEIYGKKDEDTADIAGIDGRGKDSSIIDGERTAEDEEERVLETLSDAPVSDDFDTHETRDENRDMELTNVGNTNPQLLFEEERNLEFLNELPVEGKPEVHFDQLEDSEASDIDWETGYHSALHLDYDYEYTHATDAEPDPEAGEGGGQNRIINYEFIINTDNKDCCFDDFFADEVSQESYEESLNSDAYSSSDDGESTGSYDHLEYLNSEKTLAPAEVQEEQSEPAGDEEKHIMFETSFDNLNHQYLPKEDAIAVTEDQESNLENYEEGILTSSSIASGKEPHSEGAPLNLNEGDHIQDDLKRETDESSLVRVTDKSKKSIQESDNLESFNPRGPNFLPLEPDPDGEKVDLRHQDLDERKNSEEWMVDYALRQVVTKLGPARKRKVALLVEAFEKVMPITKCDLQLSAFDQARPMQACT